MKRPTLIVLSAILLLSVYQCVAFADQNDRYIRLRYVEGDVTIQPSDNQRPETASINTPVLDGDVIDARDGRAELAFRNGVVIRIADYSTVRINSSYSPMTVELLQGTIFVDSMLVSSLRDELRVSVADAQVYLIEEGVMRVDLGTEGSVRVTSIQGEIEVAANGRRVLLENGERTYVDPGQYPESPSTQYGQTDELDDWNESRMDQYARQNYDRDYNVNESIYYDTYDLANYGNWTAYGSYGQVWVPYASYGWRPYYDGRWIFCNGGWFWVSYEPWGWAPYHYGRWGWGIDIGWYWIPGTIFAPAWVSWYDYGDYIGWCPLNYYNRPIVGYNYYNIYNYPLVQKQKTIDAANSWTFVKKRELGTTDIKGVSAAPTEVQKIRIDEKRIVHSPQSQLVNYLLPKGPSPKTHSVDTKTLTREKSFVQPRGDSRSTTATIHREEQFRREDPVPQRPVIKSTRENQQYGKSPVYQPSTTPTPRRDWKAEHSDAFVETERRGFSDERSRQIYDRNLQFNRENEVQERHFGPYVSPYYREKDRNTDRGSGNPWFRDPESHQPYSSNDPREVSPRYSDEAKKLFERFERGTAGIRPEYEPRVQPQPRSQTPEPHREFRSPEPRRMDDHRSNSNRDKSNSSKNQKPPDKKH